MSMFCYQCQETVKNQGCTLKGVCGKQETTSDLQDLLIYILQGISLLQEKSEKKIEQKYEKFIVEVLFATITNANFDDKDIVKYIKKAFQIRDEIKKGIDNLNEKTLSDSENFYSDNIEELQNKAKSIGIMSYSSDEDIRSLKSLLLYGIKGLSAYTDHAGVLGFYNNEIYDFVVKGLAVIQKDLSSEELVGLVMECGATAVKAMALLDKANTETYGHPEITKVNIGVGDNPGILISGHDLKDMEELLKQTEGEGVDVYTHSEMLPANYYPAFKKYKHLRGNYGSSWWKQTEDFESFNGPVLMTTNCLVPPKDSYKDRVYITGVVGFKDLKHIPDRVNGHEKDFSEIIELAKKCPPPTQIETGEIIGGFAHDQVFKLADKVVDAIKSGAIKRFVVMAGCDGRQKSRTYFTEVAENLPKDTVILTAGCAKYRYNKLGLGDIGGIPRVLDAGQCNDSYSLALIALKLKEVFDLDDINNLPLSFDIAWYEQKAVTVLLALLHLGVKKIHLGPTVPAFLSPNVVNVLVEKFDIKPITNVNDDIELIMKGE